MKQRERGSLDAQLRDLGFKIHSRPSKGEPIWERLGIRYTQKAALEVLARYKETHKENQQ